MTPALKAHSFLLLHTRGDSQAPLPCKWGGDLPPHVFSWQGWQNSRSCLCMSMGNLVGPQGWWVHLKVGPEQPQVTSYSWHLESWAWRNYQSTFCNQIAWCPQASYLTPLSLLSTRRELDSWYLLAIKFHEFRNLWGCLWVSIASFYLWDSQNQTDGSQRKLQLWAYRTVSDPWR